MSVVSFEDQPCWVSMRRAHRIRRFRPGNREHKGVNRWTRRGRWL